MDARQGDLNSVGLGVLASCTYGRDARALFRASASTASRQLTRPTGERSLGARLTAAFIPTL